MFFLYSHPCAIREYLPSATLMRDASFSLASAEKYWFCNLYTL